MEYEVRFYYNTKELNNLLNKLKEFNELKMGKRTYEKTIQYDHPNQEMSFYNKEIDGRYRIRVSKNEDCDKSKISWKRRLPKNQTGINSEEEVEVAIKYEEINNLIFLTENVLKMKSIESYERYRTTFSNEEIEIALDEYPFGIALEIEAKSDIIMK